MKILKFLGIQPNHADFSINLIEAQVSFLFISFHFFHFILFSFAFNDSPGWPSARWVTFSDFGDRPNESFKVKSENLFLPGMISQLKNNFNWFNFYFKLPKCIWSALDWANIFKLSTYPIFRVRSRVKLPAGFFINDHKSVNCSGWWVVRTKPNDLCTAISPMCAEPG